MQAAYQPYNVDDTKRDNANAVFNLFVAIWDYCSWSTKLCYVSGRLVGLFIILNFHNQDECKFNYYKKV